METSEVPGAAALRHDPAARLERRVQAAKQLVVVGDPVERGRAENGVERLGEGQLGAVPQYVRE
jgi:hypothetical protein